MGDRYSDEEVDAILRRALEEDGDGVSHDELVAAAQEVGVAPATLTRAAEHVRQQRAIAERATARRRTRWRGVLRRALTLGIVGTFLVAVDLLTPGGPWAHWPALAFALHVALRARAALVGRDTDEREARAELDAEARRRAAEEAARRNPPATGQLRKAEAAFEVAVERGVAHLLQKAAGAIDAATAEPTPPDTEFGRYVARKKVVKQQRPVPSASQRPAPPVRARVAAASDAEEVAVEVEERDARDRASADSPTDPVHSDNSATDPKRHFPAD